MCVQTFRSEATIEGLNERPTTHMRSSAFGTIFTIRPAPATSGNDYCASRERPRVSGCRELAGPEGPLSRKETTFNGGEFVQAVCTAAQQAFADNVKIKIAPSDGALSNEISMPLALILNELLTNAVKHGLKDRKHGTVKVQLTRTDHKYKLIVEDDGCGCDMPAIRRHSSGLGLVSGLAHQLGGSFEILRSPGARCIVSFPADRPVLQ